MSSYLQNQLSAFQSDVFSTASRFSQKRGIGSHGTSTPRASTPTPSSNDKVDLKRKRPEPANVVYSQPPDTHTGKYIMTQVTYVVEYLKGKDKPVLLKDLFDYLSVQDGDKDGRRALEKIFTQHPKIEYTPNALNGKGAFRFRPIHNVRSGEELLAYLQRQPTAQGILARELKEGWPGAIDTIDALEMEGKLLVTRNKKDNTPKMVWVDDPSLRQLVDDEFVDLWKCLKVPPTQNELREELKKFGLTPTSQIRELKAGPKKDEKKKKKPRSGGRQTNAHMAGVLKDFSHLRRV